MAKTKSLLIKSKRAQLSQKQKDILIGLMLGDAHLNTQNNGKTARLMVSQGGSGTIGDAHKKYLFQVFDNFHDWCNKPPKEVIRNDCFPEGNTYKRYTFHSISHTAFVEHWRLFYQRHSIRFKDSNLSRDDITTIEDGEKSYFRKVVPKNIEDLLTETALTYWFMDDGSIKDKNSGACLLNCQSFTYDECIMLSKALNKNFGLDAQIRDKRRLSSMFGHQIYISTKSTKILDCFTSDLCEHMSYKLPKRTRKYTRLK